MGARASRRAHGGPLGFNDELSSDLSLYAKQLAWLSSAPKLSDKDEDPKPRINNLKEGSTAGELPGALPFLVMCFGKIGKCMKDRSPITWGEIESFSKQSGYKLNGWESEQLIEMSRDFCSMLYKADDLKCPPPYRADFDESDEDAVKAMNENVNKQLDQLFGK